LQLITPTQFAMMVIMALVTTIATTPLLSLFGLKKNASPSLHEGAQVGHSSS
jgi:hypothetical protein